jgi:hypothetical protein
MLFLAWFMLGWITSETEYTVDVGFERICILIMARLLIFLRAYMKGFHILLKENGTTNSP